MVYPVDTAGTVATLHFANSSPLSVEKHSFRVLGSELWQRCCPAESPYDAQEIVLEGYCERILKRSGTTPTLSNAPNPFSGPDGTEVTVSIPATSPDQPWSLMVYDANGQPVRVLHEGLLSAGVHHFDVSLSGLPAGRYTAALLGPESVVTRALLLLGRN